MKIKHKIKFSHGNKLQSNYKSNSAMTSGKISVIVRVRPPSKRESNFVNNRNIVKIIDDETIVFDPKEEEDLFYYHGVRQQNRDLLKRVNKNLYFTFDRIFGFESTNVDVFENSIQCYIETLMNGYNCSVFAYGATGSGKTHTMLGKENKTGLMFLTMIELFNEIEKLSPERSFKVDVTYVEIYNENIRDLLNPEATLCLREHKKYGVMITGLQVHNIENISTLFELLEKGNTNRIQNSTDSNSESSRSHAVFQVYLEMENKTDELRTKRIAKLSMIDLAGSERGTATTYSASRFKEGANINKSLLALGNCINNLAEGKKHIPYRDSKLTRLLKDSLGGNCQTVMVANISPSSFNFEETYNTLKYAMRATKIKLNLKKNLINTEGCLLYYINLVDLLTKENLKLKQTSSKCSTCKEREENNFDNLTLELEIKNIYTDKQNLLDELHRLENEKNLLLLEQEYKMDFNFSINMLDDDKSNQLVISNFNNLSSQQIEEKSLDLKKKIADLNRQIEEINLKHSDFLKNSSKLQSYADRENLKIDLRESQSKTNHFESVCQLQAKEIVIRNRLIQQFAKMLKINYKQLQLCGITETHSVENCNLFENYSYLQNSNSISGEEHKSFVEIINNNKRRRSEEFSRSKTFVITPRKLETSYSEKIWRKGNMMIPYLSAIFGEILHTVVSSYGILKRNNL